MVLRGFKAVVWSQSSPTFPYVKGMVAIFLSWVSSMTHPQMCLYC